LSYEGRVGELKLLIDENLSPTLVQKLAEIGIPAQHVAHVGLAVQPDSVVWAYAFEHDFALFTLNVADFLELARNVELHPGAIVLRRAGLDRDEQWAYLQRALAQVDVSATLVNKVIEVAEDGTAVVPDMPEP
jgi:predicted nuclease of predicted toxin-antitoxin system